MQYYSEFRSQFLKNGKFELPKSEKTIYLVKLNEDDLDFDNSFAFEDLMYKES